MPKMCALLTLLLLTSGCAKLVSVVHPKHKSKPTDRVEQILCLWRPVEGRGLDNLPSRGFAGQIAFLANGTASPVEVDGDVQIFLFDDLGTPQQQTQPLHTFNFVDGAWRAHLKETSWGVTYQLFIPYVRKGDHDAECSLVVRFLPKKGHPVDSALANIALRSTNGPPPPVPALTATQQLPATSHGAVQPASAQIPRFESFTIPIPSASERRLR